MVREALPSDFIYTSGAGTDSLLHTRHQFTAHGRKRMWEELRGFMWGNYALRSYSLNPSYVKVSSTLIGGLFANGCAGGDATVPIDNPRS